MSRNREESVDKDFEYEKVIYDEAHNLRGRRYMQKDTWVIFGAGEAGISAFAVLGMRRFSFFIDDNIEKQSYFIGGIPVISLQSAKERMEDATIILGTIKPLTEKKMRELLADITTGPIFSFYELCHIIKYEEYDFSPILEKMWDKKQYDSFMYHIKVWVNSSTRVLVNPINELCKKYLMGNGNQFADVACGYGFWSYYFKNKGFEVLGVDNDPCCMEVYHCIGEEYSGMRGIEADIRNMSCISNEVMDVSFCTNTIHIVSNWRKVISEMIRITRPGGHVILNIADPRHLFFKRIYHDLSGMQWDATKENIMTEISSKMVLMESFGIYDMECINWSRMPTHYLLVFRKN